MSMLKERPSRPAGSEQIADRPNLPWVLGSLRFSRRRLLAASAGALGASLLAACGGDDTEPAATATMSAAVATPTAPVPAPAATATVAASTATPDSGTPWTFTDSRGVTVTLPTRPSRIVASVDAAGALWDYGIHPIAVFGPTRRPDGAPMDNVGRMDLDQVQTLGDAFGDFDLEELLALNADLVVDETWGGPEFVWLSEDTVALLPESLPLVGVGQWGGTLLDSIELIEELAWALGASPDDPEVQAGQTALDDATAALQALLTEKLGLSVLYATIDFDQLYVLNPAQSSDLAYFTALGLQAVEPATDDYWEALSLEQVNRYPADVIFLDSTYADEVPDVSNALDPWYSLPAVQAGQLAVWKRGPHSRLATAIIIEHMLEVLGPADPNVVEE